MNWPFVRRAVYESMRERALLAENGRDTAWQLVATAQKMWGELFDKYHALKLSGAAIPEPPPAKAPKPTPDPVTQAILKKAGTSRQLRKHFADYVTEQRTAGVDEDAIAAAILAGVDDDPGVPG